MTEELKALMDKTAEKRDETPRENPKARQLSVVLTDLEKVYAYVCYNDL